jgi:RimJ/RimL family protein N-acetyltransferase
MRELILETPRLRLRRLTLDDAPFILELVNQPSWLAFIGNHQVNSLAEAVNYIVDGPHAMLAEHGVALCLVERILDGTSLGLCGIVKRDTLPEPDIGFAFLERYSAQGYALEAAKATMDYAIQDLHLPRVLAITLPHNARSIKLLQRLGFVYERPIKLTPEKDGLMLYAYSAA